MKLAILSRAPRIYSTQRLKTAALDRGHEVKVLDTLRFAIDLSRPQPDLMYRGKLLSEYDAILQYEPASAVQETVPSDVHVVADAQLARPEKTHTAR